MITTAPTDRRRFLKVSTLLAGSILVPSLSRAATHSQSDLPYAFDALDPHIDARTMEIHFGKHHAGYVNNLNNALADNAALADIDLDSLMGAVSGVSDPSLQTTLRNNGGGHWNHAFFWESLAPESKSGKPSSELSSAINAAFGAMEEFQGAFAQAAGGRFGSGWAWLIAREGKLHVTSTPNQDNPLMSGIVPAEELGTPLLGLDVWEHAYYLHYQNRRADYVSAFWNVVNWDAVSGRFADLG